VMVVGFSMLVGLAAAVGLLYGSATVARHRVETAADLSALAGARRALDGAAAPCAEARRIAEDNGSALVACQVVGLEVEVSVAKQVRTVGIGTRMIGARARAGPVDEDLYGPPGSRRSARRSTPL
jgi:secretion/DNA translocation related TadE-like protein